jgi:hypothetical protein
MKKLVTILALTATVIASPAFAAKAANNHRSSDTVTVDGHVVGQDPDANVRLQLLRDAQASQG